MCKLFFSPPQPCLSRRCYQRAAAWLTGCLGIVITINAVRKRSKGINLDRKTAAAATSRSRLIDFNYICVISYISQLMSMRLKHKESSSSNQSLTLNFSELKKKI
jgi:hypothetical protein